MNSDVYGGVRVDRYTAHHAVGSCHFEAPILFNHLFDRARKVADSAFLRAGEYDFDGAYPLADVQALHDYSLLTATLPIQYGGSGLDALATGNLLRQIGYGSLSLGRLFEGHINALRLIVNYGSNEQIQSFSMDAASGKLFGVWNTDDGKGLHLVSDREGVRLKGRKVLASGAGFIERPLITASDEKGRRFLVAPRLRAGERGDISGWTVLGMRASATGAVDFTDIQINPADIIGTDGDYERQPLFSGGAWRFAAVHLGGIDRLFDLLREHLRRTNRGADPHQLARLGQAALATESASLWVERAAEIAESPTASQTLEQTVAFVNLARLAVERAGLDVMELVHRSVGLQAFVRPNPIERVTRDLATYLRQPGPDRALTTAAEWTLSQSTTSVDLWNYQ